MLALSSLDSLLPLHPPARRPPQASVICVVYSVDDRSTFERVTSHWLPTIRRALQSDGEHNAVPVILVGNKIDVRQDPEAGHDLEGDITPVMRRFKEVETCVEVGERESIPCL